VGEATAARTTTHCHWNRHGQPTATPRKGSFQATRSFVTSSLRHTCDGSVQSNACIPRRKLGDVTLWLGEKSGRATTPSQDPVFRLFWVGASAATSHWVLPSKATCHWSNRFSVSLLSHCAQSFSSFPGIATWNKSTAPEVHWEGGGIIPEPEITPG